MGASSAAKLSASNKSARQSITLPASLDQDLEAVGKEALRIHESAEFSAQAQFEQAKTWRTLNTWLGVPAATLAAIGGSAVLGGSKNWEILGVPGAVIGGLLALAAGALTAILTTVNASRRMTQAQSSGNAYLQLQTEARQLVTVDLAKSSYENARDALTGLTSSRNELNKTADVPGRRAYKRARRNLYRERGQDYSIDGDQ